MEAMGSTRSVAYGAVSRVVGVRCVLECWVWGFEWVGYWWGWEGGEGEASEGGVRRVGGARGAGVGRVRRGADSRDSGEGRGVGSGDVYCSVPTWYCYPGAR